MEDTSSDIMIVAATPVERENLRRGFPDLPIVVPGNAFSGAWYSAILVTRAVDTRSDWFNTRIVPRLRPGGRLLQIMDLSHAPFFG